MYFYSATLAGLKVFFCFHYKETAELYGASLTPCSFQNPAIEVPAEVIAKWQQRWNTSDKFRVEYILSCSYACDFIMQHRRIVLHGVSFLWNDYAYIFTAPSGTGKTTQINNWQRIFPNEIEVQNGDKPILQLCDHGEILVHSSPWKGKEGFGKDDLSAPLGGIIFLKQGNENRIERLLPGEAARLLFGRFYSTFNTEKEVLSVADILEQIITKSKIWLMYNTGDDESTILARRTLQGGGYYCEIQD